MKSTASFALACALVLWPHATPRASAAQEAPAQTQVQPESAQDGAPPPQQGGLVPVNQVDAPIYSIPDIRAHRGQELSYVRRLADRVVPDLAGLDLTAEPIMTVGGHPVSRNAYRKRALMYSGGNEVDKHITHLLTQQEIDRELADFMGTLAADAPDRDAGIADFRARFQLDEAAIDRKFEELKEQIRQQTRQGLEPGAPDPSDAAIAEYEASIHSSIGMEAYRQLLAADALFEKVFLPFPSEPVGGEAYDMSAGPPPLDDPRPEWLPQVTWDALGHDDQGRNLRSFVKSWAIDGSGIPGMFKPSILAKIREGLIAEAGVSFFFDKDLPDDIFMEVGGQFVPVSEMWYLVENKLADTDNELIIRELLTLAAMKEGLTAAGKWLGPEEFDKLWQEHKATYANTIFPLQTIILFRGYTSLDRYREHYRYRQAYNRWRRETLSDEEVLEHYQGGGRLFFERGNISVDIAYNEVGKRPFNDGTLEASKAELQEFMDRARAEWAADQQGAIATARAAAMLEAGGEGAVADAAADAAEAAAVQADERSNGPNNAAWFARVARQHPSPPSPQGGDGHNFQRSQLRMRMAEDELSIFLTGYGFSDDIYYHGQRGEVYGPWPQSCRQHAWGAETNAGSWAVSVKDFTRAGPVGAFEGRNKDLAYEDYLDLNYLNWAQESLKAVLPTMKLTGAGAGK